MNDRPERLFLMDTGASINTVDPDVARETTSLDSEHQVAVRGVQGRVKEVFRAERMRFRFANVQQDNIGSFSFDLDRASGSSNPQVAGIIGMPALGQLSITLDYRNGAVRLEYKKR